MKTFAIVGRNKTNAARLTHALAAAGFRRSSLPDVVFSLGGDGTYLFAERKFPGVPKILIRDNSACYQCGENTLYEIIDALRARRYRIKNNMTLMATITARRGKKHLTCVNDLILRNKDPTQALRFTVAINGRRLNKTFVGDGIIAATPFGSTAYFYSAARKRFTKGIGIAFNNMHAPHPPLILSEHSRIHLIVVRTTAQCAADNNPAIVTLHPGDSVTIAKGPRMAKIVELSVGWKGVFDKLFNNRRRSLL